MTPSWRKPFGVLAICAYIAIWAALVASQWERIGALPFAVQAIVYLIAGLAWIAPLKPWLSWMETGRFRQPRSSAADEKWRE